MNISPRVFVMHLLGPISGAIGAFSLLQVVEGLRLPQIRCEEMRKAGISKYPI